MKNFQDYLKFEEANLKLQEKTFDTFEQNKIDWLEDDENNGYLSEKTKIDYYRMLGANIHDLEVSKNKDLSKFTTVEIESIIKGLVTLNVGFKRKVFSAINSYLIYCVEIAVISYNPCDALDKEALYEVNVKARQKQYYTFKEIYDIIDEVDLTFTKKIIIILARYGIPISNMKDMNVQDVDVNNKVIRTMINDKYIEIDIDDKFIEIYNQVLTERSLRDAQDDALFINPSGKKCGLNFCYQAISEFQSLSKVKIDMPILLKNRRMDLALVILEEKGSITSSELGEILVRVGASVSDNRISTFKKELLSTVDFSDTSLIYNVPIKVIHEESKKIIEVFDNMVDLVDASQKRLGLAMEENEIGSILLKRTYRKGGFVFKANK